VTDETPSYGPDDLADLAGVSRRTVRYYVQRGLLPAPLGLGRGKHYTREHLDLLLRIRQLQSAGVSLEEIEARLSGQTPAPLVRTVQTPNQETWTRIEVADGVELNLRGRRLSDEQLATLVQQLKRTIGA
jgi:DNA-binding transcriptional MerR regulator